MTFQAVVAFAREIVKKRNTINTAAPVPFSIAHTLLSFPFTLWFPLSLSLPSVVPVMRGPVTDASLVESERVVFEVHIRASECREFLTGNRYPVDDEPSSAWRRPRPRLGDLLAPLVVGLGVGDVTWRRGRLPSGGFGEEDPVRFSFSAARFFFLSSSSAFCFAFLSSDSLLDWRRFFTRRTSSFILLTLSSAFFMRHAPCHLSLIESHFSWMGR